jgi:hypothetical protein
MLCSEDGLEALIARCSLGIPEQEITEGKPLTPDASAVYYGLEMMRTSTIGPEHEPLSAGKRGVELGRR